LRLEPMEPISRFVHRPSHARGVTVVPAEPCTAWCSGRSGRPSSIGSFIFPLPSPEGTIFLRFFTMFSRFVHLPSSFFRLSLYRPSSQGAKRPIVLLSFMYPVTCILMQCTVRINVPKVFRKGENKCNYSTTSRSTTKLLMVKIIEGKECKLNRPNP